jgi:DNA-binding winged helix-turn-helix (wHTH) protein/TolB-like protein
MISLAFGGWGVKVQVSSGGVFQFGLFDADATHCTLSRKGVRVKIQEKPFQVLILLLEKPGKIITREELRKALWPDGTYVDFDGSLNVILKKLRAAIDDDFENPRFVETVPRQGYRFIAPVSFIQHEEVEKEQLKTTSSPMTAEISSAPSRNASRWFTVSIATLVLLTAGAGWAYFLRSHSVVHASPKSIAVLPFSNEGAGPDFDYLRYAIADDLVSDLTNASSISVLPFATTSKYGAQPADPIEVGKELRTTEVLAGGFVRDKKNLRVNLELVDVAQNKAVWRDELTIAPQDMIGLHQKLVASATQSLLPAMNITDVAGDDIPLPKNERAFDLFLHSTMVPLDPVPNQMGIQKLEQSIALDSSYAPAWHQLAWRNYIDYQYGNGGQAAKAKSLAAYNRERELDPNAEPWISLRVEQGDLQGAYDELSEFLRRHPQDSNMHFAASYILRYAGLLDESQKECEAVLAADPVHGYRSCATAFILSGDYSGAQKYIDLDKRSGFAALMRMEIALRTGNTSAALAEADTAAKLGYHRVNAELAQAFLGHAPAGELRKIISEMEADPVSSNDPELLYENATALAFCQQPEAALQQLSKAIEGNYCSYPAMDKDPLFDSIRQRPEFAALRQAAIQCQQRFQAHRQQVNPKLRTQGGVN